MLGRNNIQPPSCLRCTVSRKERGDKGDSEATINSLSSEKYVDTLKNTFVERSSQYTSFSSKKTPANAPSEGKKFTENASVVLQQTILTHAHTKCPSVRLRTCKETKPNEKKINPRNFISYSCLTFRP